MAICAIAVRSEFVGFRWYVRACGWVANQQKKQRAQINDIVCVCVCVNIMAEIEQCISRKGSWK